MEVVGLDENGVLICGVGMTNSKVPESRDDGLEKSESVSVVRVLPISGLVVAGAESLCGGINRPKGSRAGSFFFDCASVSLIPMPDSLCRCCFLYVP
jgi:hypothetical protein